jgi:hypothetical protein
MKLFIVIRKGSLQGKHQMDLHSKKTVTQRGKTSPVSLTQESCSYNFYFWKIIWRITKYPLWGMKPELNHQPLCIFLITIYGTDSPQAQEVEFNHLGQK